MVGAILEVIQCTLILYLALSNIYNTHRVDNLEKRGEEN